MTRLTLVLLFAALAQAQETILGVYMFHRHGDRTAKQTPPANLTDLGYQEVYTSGQYYRSRYVDAVASNSIYGISPDIVLQSQISASAPADTVLTVSAQGFLQGLYPPVGPQLGTQELANGTNVTAPLNGYQLIPIGVAQNGGSSENSAWLQASTGCSNAISSSNNYFSSSQYTELLNSTSGFYQNLEGVVNGSFAANATNFKNAYTIFDLINVAEIHNATINDSAVLTPDNLFQLRTLADTHEFGLAYNSSDTARAIAGATTAAQIVQFLNSTITGKGAYTAPKLGVQFGNYATFQSFFGLANLTAASPNFYGIPDYASAMAFELFTNASTASWPSTSDMYVRFLFNNGTASNISEPQPYALFGQSATELSWTDFANGMNAFAVGTTEQWCQACGNTTGTCAATSSSGSGGGNGTTSPITSAQKSGNGLSPAVNGVIGAMVTLAVVLGLEALVLLAGGYRVVRKRALAQGTGAVQAGEAKS